ncbi:DNA-processing protein DprA [Arcanobacterium phocisimile]|uniref:DNA-processing protein DprA n=1 Tax=Arcanobacterium phocisimile TaxID=1302235 RepID=A0ABX7IHX5_9ACTO|nr:DNA-processing protein DprA [Arcanobacterium phocisimile]QRV02692.1 DNA-processing protein DprA [Arcanobacterium phocisimile]
MIDAEHRAAQAWTYIAEGGNQLAHALITASSYEQALAWVRQYGTGSVLAQEFDDVVARLRTSKSFVERTIRAWQLRLEHYSEISEVSLGRLGAQCLIPADSCWPGILNDMFAPPLALWIRGDAEVLNKPGIAIVGSRAASTYGQRLARNLAYEISESHVVVSGGAFGIDAQVHVGALQHGQATNSRQSTIIVSAGGVDRPYPASHADLFTQAIAHGAVISESALGSAPQRHRFLSRNRIIAGLAAGTVVVEAPMRSGALSTARHAIDCGRPVGACPGQVDSPGSQGSHALIRDGATLIRHADDVREMVSWQQLQLGDGMGEDIFSMPDDGFDPVLEKVWEAIPVRSCADAQAVARVAGVSVQEAQAKLALLELTGRVSRSVRGWKRAKIKQ